MRIKRAFAAAFLALFACASGPSAQAIVGGEKVSQPWAAAFIKQNSGAPVEKRTYCSGVLVNPRWVMTAAHCPIAPGDTVVIGRATLASSQGEKRTVARIERMPHSNRYCPSKSWELCDVALVRLNAASAQPTLALAGSQVLREWGEGTAARAYGYGAASAATADRSSGYLKRAHVSIDDFRANNHTLFASGPRTAVCYGDSGGPLVVSTSRGPRLVAVVRARVGHDQTSCTRGDSQSYTKVGYRGASNNSKPFLWITHILGT
ncbi:secreted trypsin-like serine protease [Streptomyces umbrinus]|uniref:Secreted trypsin-like serine protease n=1 Tax=Streptomyces umbrinus TaxID=67370 RepID=A0ABU0TBD3_9ACTN|nr:secreted trypsin-like serine protease [Streptomyces umbrinus]